MDLKKTQKKLQAYKRGLYRLAHPRYDEAEPSIITEWIHTSGSKAVDENYQHDDYLVKFKDFSGSTTYTLVVTAHNADLASAIALEYLATERREDFQLPFSVEKINFEARLIQTSFSLNTFNTKEYEDQIQSDSIFFEES